MVTDPSAFSFFPLGLAWLNVFVEMSYSPMNTGSRSPDVSQHFDVKSSHVVLLLALFHGNSPWILWSELMFALRNERGCVLACSPLPSDDEMSKLINFEMSSKTLLLAKIIV